VPADSKIWIGAYDFDLADVASPHTITEVPMGPTGPVNFTMQDWSGGMQSVEEGIEYRGRPKFISSALTSATRAAADTVFPGQVICQPVATTLSVGSGPALGSVLAQVDFTPSGGTISTFLIENLRYQHKLSAAAPSWTQSVDLGSGQVGKDGIVHGGFIAIGYGSGGQVYSADGVTFTVATANKADAYGALGTKLYRAVRPNTVYAATAVNGTWDSGTSVGDTSFPINSLGGIEQVLMVGKEDGMHSFDQDGTVTEFTPELRTQANSNFASIRASDSFNGDYYFRTLNGVIEISGGDGTKHRVGLDQLSSPDFPTVVVQALCHDDRYLYALCANTSNDLTILRRSIQGQWHVFYWDGIGGTKQGQHIAVSSVLGYPALFYSYYDGASVYTTRFIRLSTFPNALQDTNYRFDTTVTSRFRVGRFGSAEAQMVLDQMTIQSRSCTANLTITPFYSADGGAITQFGSTAVTSNPLTTIKPATAITCNFIDLYFDLVTNSATTTPVLVGFSLKGLKRPNYRRAHQFTLNSRRGHRSIRSGERREAPTEAAADLEALLATNTYSTVKDERGATFSGLLSDIKRSTVKLTTANEEAAESIQITVLEKS